MFTTAQGVSKRSPRWGNGTKFSGWAYGLGNDQKNGPWFTYGTAGRMDIGGGDDVNAIVRVETLSGDPLIEDSLPVINVSVTRTLDLAITKALNRDIWVTNFGETPVTVELKGIALHSLCPGNSSAGFSRDVGRFTSANAVIDRIMKKTMDKTPVRVCISTGFGNNKTGCYNCLLMDAKQDSDSDATVKAGRAARYYMRFIGQKV